ncbi:MAG TPA: hypothetical protein VFR41_04100 [Acidimicrobiia bacterium]|nr:hypothetical protein [Acidimicrobiia bacterium]
MGITYRASRQTGLSIAVADGEVTEAEYHELARRQNADPDWHATTRSLTDSRTVLTPVIDADQLAAFAALYAEMRAGDPPCRAAIVTGHDVDLVSRYSELRTSEESLTIAFNDLPSACIWLDVDLEEVRAVIAELRAELGAAG